MAALHPVRIPWHHKVPVHLHLPGWGGPGTKGWTDWVQGHDFPSVRRGRQIYTEVFAPCHSLHKITFRHLLEFMTVEEVKALAAEYEIVDEDQDNEGNEVKRPGNLLDNLPKPYKNKNEAKFSNGGAAPPDLAFITKGRHENENYIFALLTAYGRDVPSGVPKPRDGLFWNPYFPGGLIGMPAPLSDDLVDYDDGTPATTSQMAKDVTCFLAWCAHPGLDEQRYITLKAAFSFAVWIPLTYYWYKSRTNHTKFKRIKVWRTGHLPGGVGPLGLNAGGGVNG